MLSAVPLSLAADGSPLNRHGQDFAPAIVTCSEAKARDAVLGVTVEGDRRHLLDLACGEIVPRATPGPVLRYCGGRLPAGAYLTTGRPL